MTKRPGSRPGIGKVIVPAMTEGGAELFAAAFRAVGIDADVTPPSDVLTLVLGSRYTGGDECFPAKVTIGDFMKALAHPATDPYKTVLFMPVAGGPCRFGQYAAYLRHVLDSDGYKQVRILSPTSEDGYAGLGQTAQPFLRTAWRAMVAADILQKLLLMIRPHELEHGAADRAWHDSIVQVCRAVETAPIQPGRQLRAILSTLIECRDRLRRIEVSGHRDKPLIGIVGEIFCRLNSFSNQDMIRRLEEYGAEAWISGFGEWVWYTNAEELRLLRLQRRLLSWRALGARLRCHVQRRDEEALLEPFQVDFAGCSEPHVEEVLEAARRYLPPDGAMGEMVLNIGNVSCFARRGVDGVIDISPFTCMNGIVSEAIYPRLSHDLGGIPIRNFYFDGTQCDLDMDLGVFLELAWTYRRAKVKQVLAGRC